MQKNNKTSAEFDSYASSYAELIDDPLRNRFSRDPLHFHRRKCLVIDRMLKRAGVTPGTQRWLDVGCGQGDLLQLAGSSFAQAMGCDPSACMLSSDVRFKTFQQPSPVELPFPDQSFDLVTAACVLHHVHGQDRVMLLKEMRRVLSPGGFCCIIEHNPWNPLTRAIVKRCPVDAGAELLTVREAGRLLENSGFLPPRREFFLYLPESLFLRFSFIERMLSALPFGGQYTAFAQVSSM